MITMSYVWYWLSWMNDLIVSHIILRNHLFQKGVAHVSIPTESTKNSQWIIDQAHKSQKYSPIAASRHRRRRKRRKGEKKTFQIWHMITSSAHNINSNSCTVWLISKFEIPCVCHHACSSNRFEIIELDFVCSNQFEWSIVIKLHDFILSVNSKSEWRNTQIYNFTWTWLLTFFFNFFLD